LDIIAAMAVRRPNLPDAEPPAARLVAVLDMGASAIRLAIAELGPDGARILEEVAKGVRSAATRSRSAPSDRRRSTPPSIRRPTIRMCWPSNRPCTARMSDRA